MATAINTAAAVALPSFEIGEDCGVVKHGDLAIERVLRLRVSIARSKVFEDYTDLTTSRSNHDNMEARIREACRNSGTYSKPLIYELQTWLTLAEVKAIRDYEHFITQSSEAQNTLQFDGVAESVIIELAKAKHDLKTKKRAKSPDVQDAEAEVESKLLSLVNRHNGVNNNADGIIADVLDRAAKRETRMTEDSNAAEKFLKRLGMAIFGSLTLLVPMLIMYLVPEPLAVLLVTSISVLVVATLLTYFLKDAEGKDLFGAAAAYAAVLVVFVGTGDSKNESRSVIAGTISGNGTLSGTLDTSDPDPTFTGKTIGGIVGGVIIGVLLLSMLSPFLFQLQFKRLPGQERRSP